MHWFGLNLPEGVKARQHWGARAILHRVRQRKTVIRKRRIVGYVDDWKVTFETLPDRSNYRGPYADAPESRPFFRWLNKVALPWLAKAVDKEGLAPDEDREIALDREPFHLRANPRSSYGYLYLVAWEDEVEAPE